MVYWCHWRRPRLFMALQSGMKERRRSLKERANTWEGNRLHAAKDPTFREAYSRIGHGRHPYVL